MIYCQTLATDLFDSLDKDVIDRILSLQYLSALTISKQINAEDEFYLITDSKGKNFTNKFPYKHIITALDHYPYSRPLQMSAYKLFSIDVFRGKSFVHFDNDVFLFRPIPEFDDTLVQSCEDNFVHCTYINKIQHFDWEFPAYIKEIQKNYNPGVFGFSYDSKVRDEYYKIFLEFYSKNINFIENEKCEIKKASHLKEMQDVCLVLEEGLLWYLCKKEKIDVVELIQSKYDNYENVWGTFSKGKYRGVNWDFIEDICYRRWRQEKYIHLMNYNQLISNDKTIDIPQKIFLEIYYKHKAEVEEMLKGNVWKQ